MAIRNIVSIDEDKCNGCGLCITACAEGAIELIDGKAKLVSDIYCDGLGDCLGHCPEDAITVEPREAQEFDEVATEQHLKTQAKAESVVSFVCPGAAPKTLNRPQDVTVPQTEDVASQLSQGPVQLKLVSPSAPYFAGADLLLVADCVPFAMGDFHNTLLKKHAVAIGCPKLDDVESHIEKVKAILEHNDLNSFSVVHMEVYCCSGLTAIARKAITRSGKPASFEDITIGVQGDILHRETVQVACPSSAG
jgi:NAD-dependent dihydropyrimidine dehydrogenase PreA subunit